MNIFISEKVCVITSTVSNTILAAGFQSFEMLKLEYIIGYDNKLTGVVYCKYM